MTMERIDGAIERLLVAYGSQSGCAQEVAERIAREARRRLYCPVELMCMDDYDIKLLPDEKYAIFVASTTGQGETPDNMKLFWRFLLRKSLPSDLLLGLNFTVFGLGDSSYPIYNAVARRLYQRFLTLGAKPFFGRGLGDDQHVMGYDGGLEPWLKGLWAVLEPLSRHVDGCSGAFSIELSYRVQFLSPSEASGGGHTSLGSFGHGVNRYTPVPCTLLENRRLTTMEHSHDVRHIVFDVELAGFTYSPGDVLVLHPRNLEEPTRDFITNYLALNPDQMVLVECISSFSNAYEIDGPISLFELFLVYVDIFSTPRRYFFEVAAQFAAVQHEKVRLEELASSGEQEDLYRYCHRERRSFVEVLQDFKSVKLPLDILLHVVPRLQPRQFSISSSPQAHLNEVHITASILKYTTPYKRKKIGICSAFLEQLKPGEQIPLWIRKGSFHFPPELSNRQVIMVGAGTGIAPFRSYCQQMRARNPLDKPLGYRMVIFGNRNRDHDFLYEEEWEQLLKSGIVNQIHTAFSRDQNSKVYVQHRMIEQSEMIWQMIFQNDGYIYIAGNKDLPAALTKSLERIAVSQGGFSSEEANQFVKKLVRTGRLQVECWS